MSIINITHHSRGGGGQDGSRVRFYRIECTAPTAEAVILAELPKAGDPWNLDEEQFKATGAAVRSHKLTSRGTHEYIVGITYRDPAAELQAAAAEGDREF